MEVDALLAWLALLLGREKVYLEQVVGSELLCLDALRVIGPQYLGSDLSRPERAFDDAIRRFDRAELSFPPHLLMVDWERLMNVDDGQLSVLARHEAVKVLKILLGAAVKCNDKARFVQQIQKLPPAYQKTLMMVIQNELLKESVMSKEEQALRARVVELESRLTAADAAQRQNAELKAACDKLEEEVRRLKQVEPVKVVDPGFSEEQKAMKERLRFLQEELVKRETEIVNLTAVAAEAAAAVKHNRSLRDELDLTREQLDIAREKLNEVVQEGPSNIKELSALKEQLKVTLAEAKQNEAASQEARKLKMDVSSLKASLTDLQDRNNELTNLCALKSAELSRLTESYIESKSKIGELSLELENARSEAKVLLQQQAQHQQQQQFQQVGGSGGGSLLDELVDPKDEQLQLLEEERDQLLNDLKLTKELLAAQQQASPLSSSFPERDVLLNELKAAKELLSTKEQSFDEQSKEIKQLKDALLSKQSAASLSVDGEQMARLQSELAENSRRSAELNEKIALLEAEKTQLRNYLKIAKEKLASPTAAASNAGASSNDLELRLMAQKVHAAGMEILRLKQEAGKSRLQDVTRVNGLLNHLRSVIDPYD